MYDSGSTSPSLCPTIHARGPLLQSLSFGGKLRIFRAASPYPLSGSRGMTGVASSESLLAVNCSKLNQAHQFACTALEARTRYQGLAGCIMPYFECVPERPVSHHDSMLRGATIAPWR